MFGHSQLRTHLSRHVEELNSCLALFFVIIECNLQFALSGKVKEGTSEDEEQVNDQMRCHNRYCQIAYVKRDVDVIDPWRES